MPMPRLLTKSRFKLALECPTKLHYTGKREYLNRSDDDGFLQSLAEGGFQVGALACLMHPGGVEVTETEHAAALARTRELLRRDEVTIYEAALGSGALFVRVDVLVKRGAVVELVEVKAKSWHPERNGNLRARRGGFDSAFLPYLQDIAFQRHVAGLALPGCELRSFLMLADTSRTASVDGLNQRFRVQRDGARRSHVVVAEGTALADLGDPVLTRVPVDDQVAEILAGTVHTGEAELPFADAVAQLAAAYAADRRIPPHPGAQCGACEFRAAQPPAAGEPRSGFHECWREAFGWQDTDFAQGTVLDIAGLRHKGRFIQRGLLKPAQLNRADLGVADEHPGPEGLSPAQRQWLQCQGRFLFDGAGLAQAMQAWRWPLHFIDFETSAVALPFLRGHRPYETVAFQFSHHVLLADGRVEHRTQFLQARPGSDPTLPFLRALRDALSADEGTITRWATHENTVLNQLRAQLLAAPPQAPDVAGLIGFIEHITSRDEPEGRVHGARTMVDLCQLAERHFFDPLTGGSSSLKRVLPALMRRSATLRRLYGEPVYGSAAMPSLNLSEGTRWWQQDGARVRDPYELLPTELHDGGAAMAAYARLQFETLPDAERRRLEAALLRYCELDTLAMVMVVQAWQAWIAGEAPLP